MKVFKIVSHFSLKFKGNDKIIVQSSLTNYDKTIIDLAPLAANTKHCVKNMLNKLQNEGFAKEEIKSFKLPINDDLQLIMLLIKLEQKGIIYSHNSECSKNTLNDIKAIKKFFKPVDINKLSILMVSDIDCIEWQAKEIAAKLKLDLHYAGSEFINLVAKHDCEISSNTQHVKSEVSNVNKAIEDYDAFIICVSRLNIEFIRNLSKVCLQYNKKITVGILDEQFAIAFSLSSSKNNCSKCVENTLTKVIKNINVSKKQNKKHNLRLGLNLGRLALSNILVNVLLSEAFLVNYYTQANYQGKILSIVYPSLEIKTHYLKKGTGCLACKDSYSLNSHALNRHTHIIFDNILESMVSVYE